MQKKCSSRILFDGLNPYIYSPDLLKLLHMTQPHEIPVANRLIVSLYDYSEIWPRPYIQAGYPVMLWDLKKEGDIIKHFGTLIADIENAIEAGYLPYGLLAAPPCDDFACSGARWFAAKDASVARCGDNDIADNSVDLHKILAEIPRLVMDHVEQLAHYAFKFWALENPVGRIATLLPWLKDYKKLTFDPCEFGDPYTKKTVLYGEFNSDLKKTPIDPVPGVIHRVSGWDKEKQKTTRSKTPEGFAAAFFQANQ